MIFTETKLNGVYIIDIEPIEDERGFFARAWCKEEFENLGLNSNLKQCNISFNKNKGTIRGMHFQTAPYEESKLVRCVSGAIYDVIIDLRENSESFMNWIGVMLTAKNRKALYVPEGCAHGFQTIEENSEVFYQMSQSYHSEYAKGIRWDDVMFDIKWPLPVTNISDRDRGFESYKVKEELEL